MCNYQIINLYRQIGRAGGGVCIFIHGSIKCKESKNLSISKTDSETLSIEITNKTKNIVLILVYRPPNSSLKEFKNFLKPIFDNIRRNNKDFYLVGDFNINVLDYENNVKVKNYVDFAFQNSLMSLINKPTRVTKTNATAIDHSFTNAFLKKNKSKRESSKLKFRIIFLYFYTANLNLNCF